MNEKVIHIFEPHSSGHRMQYVRRIVSELTECHVIHLSTFPSSDLNPVFKVLVEAFHSKLQIHYFDGESEFTNKIKHKNAFYVQYSYWQLFHKQFNTLNINDQNVQIIIPYLDYCSYMMGLLGSPFGDTSFEGIVMRPDFHWRKMGVIAPMSKLRFIKLMLFKRLLVLKVLTKIATIDPSLFDWVQHDKPHSYRKVSYMEDASDMNGVGDINQARKYFNIPQNERVILLFGSIDLRKGVSLLLEVLKSTEYSALIVGKQSDEVVQLILKSNIDPRKICVINRFVTAQEEWLAFNAADYVWIAYKDFYGSSGVLAQAMQLKLNVIHSGVGLIEYQLRKSRTAKFYSNLSISILKE